LRSRLAANEVFPLILVWLFPFSNLTIIQYAFPYPLSAIDFLGLGDPDHSVENPTIG
jgi:hypothetical protein